MLTICDDPENHRECKVVGFCRDCRHWKDPGEPPNTPGEIWGECSAIGTATSATPDARASLFAAFAEEGPTLYTRSDFGCVLFAEEGDG